MKMWTIREIFVYLATFLLLIELCSCLECYDCASMSDASCSDKFDEVANAGGTSECGDKQTHCIKFKTVQYLDDSGFITGKARETNVVSRMCIRRDGYKDGCRFIEASSGFHFECLCSTDNCNGGKSILPSLIVIIMAVLCTIFILKQ